MSETQKQHAQRQKTTATSTTPEDEQQHPTEGPAATFERVRPDPALSEEQASAADGASAEGLAAGVPPQEEAATTPLPAGEDAKDAELQAEKAKANDYLEQWRRTAADFANFKRRTEQDRAEMAKLFNESLVKSLLPVLDNFERALAAIPADLKSHNWVEGVTLTEKQMRDTLEKEGLNAIQAVGQKFDPNLHEAVAHDISDEHEEDSVIEEFQKGYKLHDRVIRPSMVKVSRRS